MKQKVCILSLILIMLTGCGDKINNNSKENINSNNTSNLIFIKSGYNEYNNGCVYGEDPVKYLDYATLETAPLCAVPNCTHNTKDCLARKIGNTPVFYNNYVYFFESNYGAVRETTNGQEFYIDSKLMKASLDSSEVDTVCEFHDAAPFNGDIALALNEDELFFVSDNCNPVKDDYGNYSWGNVGGIHYLSSVNLDTGVYTNYGSIYDGDKEYKGSEYSSSANIIGIYNNKLFINYAFIKDNDELQSIENANDLEMLWTRINIEFDFRTKTLKESEMPFSLYVNNDIYTHYDYSTSSLKVNYKGTENDISCENPYFSLKECNGKLFFTEDSLFYDLDTMEKYDFGEYSKYDIMGYSDGNYIFANSRKAVKITEEELLSFDKE